MVLDLNLLKNHTRLLHDFFSIFFSAVCPTECMPKLKFNFYVINAGFHMTRHIYHHVCKHQNVVDDNMFLKDVKFYDQ